jgi:hypothetical protein
MDPIDGTSPESRARRVNAHDVVVAAMRARTPVDHREQDCIEEFLTAIDRLADDPFYEHANAVHVTHQP